MRKASVEWGALHRQCAVGVVAGVAVLGTAAVPVVWAGSQDLPGDRRWWLVVCGVALLAAVGASLPLLRQVSVGDYVVSCVALVLLLVLALGTVFAAAQAASGVRTRLHEPRRVVATVTACRTTGRQLDDQDHGRDIYGCTYHWSVDGREFSEERPTDELYPDGHETRVWLDGGQMITGRPSLLGIPFWGVLALAGLLGAIRFSAFLAWKAREVGLLGQ
ncbi:hypothetical protein [Kitasatospora sp. MAA19]|uniref:hypothetical protein n=1 Tax=Kitasatospora sp. MAA19 TaxID=3035090 RepID=UPI0024759E86|nr:hypothetical protein [Kitasatospora sp. MAA19]